MLKYKGYTGVIEYDDDADLLFGRVIDVNAVITFMGKSTTEVKKEFEASVDCYLVACKRKGIEPKRSFSGNVRLRLSPQKMALRQKNIMSLSQ
jgi:predicted HicB family RNase H-like nuclease